MKTKKESLAPAYSIGFMVYFFMFSSKTIKIDKD